MPHPVFVSRSLGSELDRCIPDLARLRVGAVERAADDPRRPAGYRSLDAFWRHRSYRRGPNLRTTFTWQEIRESGASPKPMVFSLKPATAHRSADEPMTAGSNAT